jgi:hypothetical protein
MKVIGVQDVTNRLGTACHRRHFHDMSDNQDRKASCQARWEWAVSGCHFILLVSLLPAFYRAAILLQEIPGHIP